MVNHPPCRALLPSLPLLRLSRHVTPHQRALFDGRPRGDGYTHFGSAQGHSESGARTWYAVLGAVPSSLLLYYLGSHPPSRCALLAHTRAGCACVRQFHELHLTRYHIVLVLRSAPRPRAVHWPNTDD